MDDVQNLWQQVKKLQRRLDQIEKGPESRERQVVSEIVGAPDEPAHRRGGFAAACQESSEQTGRAEFQKATVSNERDTEASNDTKLVKVVKDLQEIGSRIESIRDNLLRPERPTDDENTVELRSLQRDLLGEFASLARTLFKTATCKYGADDAPGDLSSDLNLFLYRCQKALRVRGGRVKRGRAKRKSRRITQ